MLDVPSPSVAPASPPVRIPELLAPAGDWDCARAAVENGADAIYFGLTRFNARLRADNFTEADLPGLMTWLHRRGVRGYVTFNTLVFADELPEAEAFLRNLIAAGVDAAIVQDVGICRLIRAISPDFPIHASTQMTISSPAGVAFARDLGCQVVVLARENTVGDLAQIRAAFPRSPGGPALEVFVHGALCVAYSGQCLTSEALGGRSANRGECAQACRLPYELLSDGRPVDLGERRYLLSPQDLAGLAVIPQLVQAGVDSLKIEGRLKSPQYVASITRTYRAALDRLVHPETSCTSASPEVNYEMEMAFSRGLHTGWLRGIDNQTLVHGRFGKKRGVLLGEVTRIGSDRVWLRPTAPLKAGDGVVFDAGRPNEKEEGGRIFAAHPSADRETALTFLRGAVDFARIRPGDRVWKTSDPALERSLDQTYAGNVPRFQRPLHIAVRGRAGEPLTLEARDDAGNTVRISSVVPLVRAENQPLDEARLRLQLGRLGGTPFRLGDCISQLDGPVILPLAELNRLRRETVARIEEKRAQSVRWQIRPRAAANSSPLEGGALHEPCPSPVLRTPSPRQAPIRPASPTSPQLIVLVRSDAQLDAALASGVEAVYCEFEDPKRYVAAVERVRRARADSQTLDVFVAPPRIFKPGEDWILRQITAAGADGVLVRNYDHLTAFPGARRIGDFSLNVANPLTAAHFIEHCGLERVTASYDLNADQLDALLRQAPPDWFEIVLHQHMPMFHMEHCVFCAFLSSGKDYRDCGRPCDRHDVRLRDRVGAVHPVKADAGCRNTVFNAMAQTGAGCVTRFLAAGARRFRIEFLDESPGDVSRLIDRYRKLLRGEITAETLWREFKLIDRLGVTRGQLGRASGADLGVDRWADSKAYAAAW